MTGGPPDLQGDQRCADAALPARARLARLTTMPIPRQPGRNTGTPLFATIFLQAVLSMMALLPP